MDESERVIELLNQNNGYLTSKTARDNGIDNKTLQRMKEGGLVERAAHGLYIGADTVPDKYFLTQYRCPKGIFSHETALLLHGISEGIPQRITMTIPAGWNTPLLKDKDITFFYSVPKRRMLGVCEIETSSGVKVKAYDLERTLCDCLRYIDKLDRSLVLNALKDYTKSSGCDCSKFLNYANAFSIHDMVYRYLEVLTKDFI